MFLLVGTPGRLSWSHSFQRSRAPSWCAQGRIARCGLIYFHGRNQCFFKAKFVTFSATLTRVKMRTFNSEMLRIEKIAGLQYRVLSFVPWFQNWLSQARDGVGSYTSLYGRASAYAPLWRLPKMGQASCRSNRHFNR
jgi:hypothetical protein